MTLYRGTHAPEEYAIRSEGIGDGSLVELNSLSSFTSDREVAWEFGSSVWEVRIPMAKILFFGGMLLRIFAADFNWRWLVLAVLALTVLRMIPVALAMIGTGFRWPTVAFLGWFGPRGLATIVFGLLALDELGQDSPHIEPVAGVLAVTVLLSVFAHGFSAGPLSQAYGEWAERTDAPIAREPSVEPMSTRGRGLP